MLEKKEGSLFESVFVFFAFAVVTLAFLNFVSAVPSGPDSIVLANETKSASAALTVNVSGGYITTMNITATTQNTKWKGMVGQVTGSFTLDDSTGSSLFDWSLTNVGGEIYATRNSTTPTWSGIRCANNSLMETENYLMNHTTSYDNITKTFNGTSHASFVVATTTISANSCPTVNTYIANVSQDTDFEEVVLTDSTNFTIGGMLIYTSVIETNVVGFDGNSYDFQMIVPENGLATYTGATAYYLYVELS
jgi:hypothetical protein